MRITITDSELEQRLVALATEDLIPVQYLVIRLVRRALDLPVTAQNTALDRNAAVVATALKSSARSRIGLDGQPTRSGLTAHEVCGITGWSYMTGAKVLRHMLHAGLVTREKVPSPGAPAWLYLLVDAADAPALAPETAPATLPEPDDELPPLI